MVTHTESRAARRTWARRLVLMGSYGLLVFGSRLPAQAPMPPRMAGRIVVDTIHVAGLTGNLLGDASAQSVAIYLPPSYDSGAARRYPVLYLLHGIGGAHSDWTSPTYDGMTIQATLDTLIAAGLAREMLVVMPNGRNRYGGSLYENSVVIGRWGDYIATDLVRHVDAGYRTLARRESRGIAGHSMGGYGALTMGAQHSAVFSAVYAMSPCCLDLVGDLEASNPEWRTFLTARTEIELFAEMRRGNVYPVAYLAILAALSPDSSRRPLLVAPPFQLAGDRVTQAEPAYSVLKSQMYLARLDEYASALRTLRGLRFDYGVREEFSHIVLGTAQLSAGLAGRGIPHGFDVYEGTHRDQIAARMREAVLPFFDRTLWFGDQPIASP